MEQVIYGLGCIPSPPDERDYPVCRFTPVAKSSELPEEFMWKPLEILYQSSVDSCVAHAIATAKQKQEYDERGFLQKFSTDFIYHNRTEDMYQDEGMYPREALKKLRTDGVCEHYLLPTNTPYKNKVKITEEMRENAKYQVIDKFATSLNDNEFKSAILTHGIALMSIPIYRSFLKPMNIGFKPEDFPKAIVFVDDVGFIGYHMIAVLGWNKSGWIVQNSWGTSWGDDGIATLHYKYPIRERWHLVDKYIPLPASKYEIIFKIGEKKYTVNNQEFEMDTAPVIKNDRTLVPLRFLGKALSYGVEYYKKRKEEVIRLVNKDKEVKFVIGSPVYYVNGKLANKIMEVVPFINENWRTMIPVRFAVEALGGTVEFDNNIITIRK